MTTQQKIEASRLALASYSRLIEEVSDNEVITHMVSLYRGAMFVLMDFDIKNDTERLKQITKMKTEEVDALVGAKSDSAIQVSCDLLVLAITSAVVSLQASGDDKKDKKTAQALATTGYDMIALGRILGVVTQETLDDFREKMIKYAL